MTKMILTRGIPASGKSTWAKAWRDEDPAGRFRANRDNIRWTLGIKTGIGTTAQEEQVTYWEQRFVEYAIQSGQDVVIDDTNLRAKYVKEWLRIANAYGAEVEFHDFPVTLEEAVRRDAGRGERGERFVGPEVLRDLYNRFTRNGKLPPIPTIGDYEKAEVKFAPYTYIKGLPFAVIVDIDGTLAHMTGRSPYDPTLYHTDSYDNIIGEIAMGYAEKMSATVIVVSGRDAGYEYETRKWLNDNEFYYEHLFMRPEGDTRNDAIVKNELFEKYIAGRYNIDFVLDDRDRVVAMWRAKGLKVLQVAEGNF